MKYRILAILFLLGFSFCVKSQNISHIKEVQLPYFIFKAKDNSKNTYKINEPYQSIYLELKPDSTFLFYDISMRGFFVSKGYYTMLAPLVKLDWDSVLTYKLVQDSIASAKLFRFKKAFPFKPKSTIYQMKEHGVESISLKYDKIELLYSSDLTKKEMVYDSLVSILYSSFHQKHITVKRHHHNDMIFKKDSIWGFRIYRNGGFKTFKNDTTPLKWNMSPGYQIAQIEKGMVLYMVESSTKTYHYYFSKTLHSEIFPINKITLSKEYAHLPDFLKAFQKEFIFGLNYGAVNEQTNDFRLIEIYRKAANNSSAGIKQ